MGVPSSIRCRCEQAEQELTRPCREGQQYALTLTEEGEKLRWFLLPQDAATQLQRVDQQAAS